MFDFHTHILPNIDDGSGSAEKSIDMLYELRRQKIQTVIATPHFDIKNIDVKTFMQRRELSFQELSEYINNHSELPEIILGAEVTFYSGFFYMMERLDELCIGKTKYILVELPLLELNEDILRGLENMIISRGLIPIIAHIDRYLKFENNMKNIRALLDMGAIIQMNADYVNNIFTRRRAMKLIKKGNVQVLGSDCHNMGLRKPNIGLAYHLIESKLGMKAILQIEKNANQIIKTNW